MRDKKVFFIFTRFLYDKGGNIYKYAQKIKWIVDYLLSRLYNYEDRLAYSF